jgi:hypothetical protein
MMAQRSGQQIIGQILTDEELRAEFLERPHATDGEVDALVQTIAARGGVWREMVRPAPSALPAD